MNKLTNKGFTFRRNLKANLTLKLFSFMKTNVGFTLIGLPPAMAGRSGKGFTLIETLLSIGIVTVIGIIISALLTSNFQGSAKTQLISIAKQNGQTALTVMDNAIRNADSVVCPSNGGSSNVVTVVKNGEYTRFRYVAPSPASSPVSNGQLLQDFPIPDQSAAVTQAQCNDLSLNLTASCPDTFCNNAPAANATIYQLTDINTVTGVSITPASGNYIFNINRRAGTRDFIEISFQVGPGISSPTGAQTISPIPFQTSLQVRSKEQ